MKEIFKEINEFNDYQISNYGRVKSLKHNSEKILSLCSNCCDYYFSILLKNGIEKSFLNHRLVANAFIPNPENKPCVNHIDGNKQNNHVDNLEWVTHSENTKHAYSIGLHNQKGTYNGNSKLTENDVLTIHGLYLNGMKQKEIGMIYNTCRTNIEQIVNGKTWKCVL